MQEDKLNFFYITMKDSLRVIYLLKLLKSSNNYVDYYLFSKLEDWHIPYHYHAILVNKFSFAYNNSINYIDHGGLSPKKPDENEREGKYCWRRWHLGYNECLGLDCWLGLLVGGSYNTKEKKVTKIIIGICLECD